MPIIRYTDDEGRERKIMIGDRVYEDGSTCFDVTGFADGVVKSVYNNLPKKAAREVVAALTEVFDLDVEDDPTFYVDTYWENAKDADFQHHFAVEASSFEEAARIRAQSIRALSDASDYTKFVVHRGDESRTFIIKTDITKTLVAA